ncbi:MAG TPA: xanthine dehydrogenase family protein subunit M [Candidatus Acidoferrales bacterium]|nr:xanthine dehydrogenase family protein subunit M [Candidatus Acidoferrales bacterium]
MKPAPFEFFAPRSRDEVLEKLADYGDDARVLSGGQSLVPLMNMRIIQPRVIVSINQCRELAYIHSTNGRLVCGALTRQAEAEESAEVRQLAPLLSEAMPLVGGAANRNRGTVCGSLAHADPLAEPPAVAVALEAELIVASKAGRRTLSAEEFFVSELQNAMRPGEMLEEVRFPVKLGAKAAFVEVANRRHGFAVVGVAAQITVDGAAGCRNVRIAAIGVGARPLRLRHAERALEGKSVDALLLKHVSEAAREGINPPSDIHADADYRRHMAGVLAVRAVARIWGVAIEGT